MGVKDLWPVLTPICEKKSLWELENTSIAIDLSAWICDSNSVSTPQINMYLRNLFFRTNYLLLLGVRPIFVLEGEAPELKANTIRKRMGKENDGKNIGQRRRLKGLQNQCVSLLKCLGLECITAPGEAEAYCAYLNAKGIVSGVVTQDSDAFLYGATEVYRHFQMGPHFTCSCYKMKEIEEKLGLSRTKLIGFSILCGSDYNSGVNQVGKSTALKFLASIPDDEVYKRFIDWKSSTYFDETNKKCLPRDLQVEMSIRDKAIKDKDFPNLDVIAEFTNIPCDIEFNWGFAAKKLAWDGDYAARKFVPLLGRWHILNPNITCLVSVIAIKGKRKKEVGLDYKVVWELDGLEKPEITTWEKDEQICLSYPQLVESFNDSKAPKKKGKTGKKVKDQCQEVQLEEPQFPPKKGKLAKRPRKAPVEATVEDIITLDESFSAISLKQDQTSSTFLPGSPLIRAKEVTETVMLEENFFPSYDKKHNFSSTLSDSFLNSPVHKKKKSEEKLTPAANVLKRIENISYLDENDDVSYNFGCSSSKLMEETIVGSALEENNFLNLTDIIDNIIAQENLKSSNT